MAFCRKCFAAVKRTTLRCNSSGGTRNAFGRNMDSYVELGEVWSCPVHGLNWRTRR